MTFKIWSRFGKARLLAVVVIWAGVGWLSLEVTQAAGSAGLPSAAAGLVQLTDRAWAWVAPDERTANGALFVGDDAALLVDPGLTPDLARQFLAAAREATDRPIRFAVTTHGHLDHSLGIACLSDRELEVVAHPKTRRSLAERGARIAALIAADAASPEERAELEACRLRLPDRTVPDREVIDLGGHRVEIFHPGVAHTHGDLVVWSPVEGVLATGDLFLRDASPYMGEGSAVGWKEALDRLVDLDAQHVIPGHFDVGSTEDLARFRDYISALIERVGAALAQGVAPEEAARRVDFPEFADFGQYPQYDATFEGNALAVARELALRPAERGEGAGFRVLTTVDVGQNPHQIDFTPDGEAAYIAAAGSDQVVRVDAQSYRVTETLAVEDVPLGVIDLPSGDALAVTSFGGDAIVRYSLATREPGQRLTTGGAPSLLVGPLPGQRYLVSTEQVDLMWVLNAEKFALERSYETGDRPFPPGVTSDGRVAFVPNYNDSSVTVIDLWNERALETVTVGARPSGGAVLPGDIDYAVAVRGENKIVFINTASHQVVGSLSDGIGESPFSVVVAASGRTAFVNNTASHDVSVIALPERRVVARIPVGEIPIVMAVHPSGETLWVSSEGSHTVSIIEIPERWRAATGDVSSGAAAGAGTTEVAVLGMIHGRHRDSESWGLDEVRETIRRLNPDAVCAEIPPDRWERIWSDYTERDVIEDERVKLFPEYTDVLLALAVEKGIEIIPCAGWTKEMSDLRRTRIQEFRTGDGWADERAEYDRRLAELRSRYAEPLEENDDPRFINSDVYDERAREELSLYDHYLNEWIGPGGWTNINEAHMRLIDEAIRTHRGKRVLITFGAGHKYWFLDSLRARDDVRLLDVRTFLPEARSTP